MLKKKLTISKQKIFNLQSNIVKRWRKGTNEKNKILISTTTFSTENNYSEVWVIILAIILFNMSMAIQEIGGVGKNNKLTKYYTIPAMKILSHCSINDF